MPIVNNAYVAPTWVNDTSPYINASEMQAMCDTIELSPIANGGTGATTASGALTNLGAMPIANAKSKGSANTPVYGNSNGVLTPISSAIPVALGGTGATTLAGIRNAIGLGNTTGALPIANGGTGSTTVASARNALGLGNTSGAVPIANGGTGQTTVAGARNALGLGNTSGAVPIANGGTGATTASGALTNLGAEPKANVTSKGSANTPVYFNSSGVATPISSPIPISLGGTNATTASAALTNLGAVPKTNVTSKGSATTPVYFNSSGVAVPMSGALPITLGGTGMTGISYLDLTVTGSGWRNMDRGSVTKWGKIVFVKLVTAKITSPSYATGVLPSGYRPYTFVHGWAVGTTQTPLAQGTPYGYGYTQIDTDGKFRITLVPTAYTGYNDDLWYVYCGCFICA